MTDIIKNLKSPQYKKILTLPTILWGNFITLATIFMPLIAMGLAGLYFKDHEGPVSAVEIAGGVIAGLIAIAGVGYLLVNGTKQMSVCLEKKARRVIRNRRDAVVDLSDESLVFVDIKPKANWDKTMLEDAEDVGYLKFDMEGRRLLFEGGKVRWVIPADRIRSCDIQEHVIGKGTEVPRSIYYLLVVFVNNEGSEIEQCVAPRYGSGFFSSGKRQDQVSMMLELIERMRGKATATRE